MLFIECYPYFRLKCLIQKSIEIESTSLNRIFPLIELQVKSSKVKKDRLIQMFIQPIYDISLLLR